MVSDQSKSGHLSKFRSWFSKYFLRDNWKRHLGEIHIAEKVLNGLVRLYSPQDQHLRCKSIDAIADENCCLWRRFRIQWFFKNAKCGRCVVPQMIFLSLSLRSIRLGEVFIMTQRVNPSRNARPPNLRCKSTFSLNRDNDAHRAELIRARMPLLCLRELSNTC